MGPSLHYAPDVPALLSTEGSATLRFLMIFGVDFMLNRLPGASRQLFNAQISALEQVCKLSSLLVT